MLKIEIEREEDGRWIGEVPAPSRCPTKPKTSSLRERVAGCQGKPRHSGAPTHRMV
jgi:hypothetical protein